MSSCPGTAAGNVKAMGSSRCAYDALSRLTEGRVRVGGADFVQEVDFDAFGNITEVATSTFPPRALETSTSSNHLTYGTYNPAGSLTSWNLWSYDWDPVEMMKRRSTTGQDWRHVYTAGDERFWGVDRLTWRTSDFTLRDLDGKVLRVYEAGEGKWSRFTDYVWRGEALLARDFSYTRPEAFHLDHLGTPRLLTNHRAERLAQPNYYPFGEEITVNTQVAERLKFTGHERDTLGSPEVADDLDYMHARFANPITGRFLSVDPAQESAIQGMPQSWNRYAYGLSNPVRYLDSDGRVVVAAFEENELVRAELSSVAQQIPVLGGTLAGVAHFFLADLYPVNQSELRASAEGTFLAFGAVGAAGGGRVSGIARRLENIFAKNLTRKTAEAAARESLGEVVARKATGEAFDHITKFRTARSGAVDALEELKALVGNPKLSDIQRARSRFLIGKYSKSLDAIEEAYRRALAAAQTAMPPR